MMLQRLTCNRKDILSNTCRHLTVKIAKYTHGPSNSSQRVNWSSLIDWISLLFSLRLPPRLQEVADYNAQNCKKEHTTNYTTDDCTHTGARAFFGFSLKHWRPHRTSLDNPAGVVLHNN